MSTLYLRNGVYYIRFRKDGRLRWASTGTRSLAKARRIQQDIDTLAKGARMAEVMTLADLEANYLAWSDTHHRPATRAWFLNMLARFRGAHDGSINSITTANIESVKRRLRTELSVTSVNSVLRAMRVLVNLAINQDWYEGGNPFLRVKYLQRERKIPRWLTHDETLRLLECARQYGRDAHLFFALGLFAGLRRAEIDGLRWEHVDFAAGVLYVRGNERWRPKDHEERAIPLAKALREILELWREPEGWILAPARDYGANRYRYENRKSTAAVCRAAGLDWVTPHVLRHTFASRLASAGVDLYKIATWLGHSDPKTTRIYAHLRPGDSDIDRIGGES
jgi:integrase